MSVTLLKAAQRGGGTGLMLRLQGQSPPPWEPAGRPAAAPLGAQSRSRRRMDKQMLPAALAGPGPLGCGGAHLGQLWWEDTGTHALGRALLPCVGKGEGRNVARASHCCPAPGQRVCTGAGQQPLRTGAQVGRSTPHTRPDPAAVPQDPAAPQLPSGRNGRSSSSEQGCKSCDSLGGLL